jgi:(S)-ureidoglycine aminohydrolase
VSDAPYAGPAGGLPPQTALTTDRAIFTDAYAVIPRTVQRDIVTSRLPHWTGTRAWVLARPLSGFAETFAQLILRLDPGGGSDRPEPRADAEAVLFVTEGAVEVELNGRRHPDLDPGSYVYIPPGTDWRLRNAGGAPATLHWIRKAYEAVPGIDPPDPVVSHDREVAPVSMAHAEGRWATTMFVDPDDPRHDMHVNIVTFQPGGSIPFPETHVMEHGLYILAGTGVYLLNRDWIEVGAGDFLWLRAFCPQACYAGGPGPFRYLLYKDVNRHMPLAPLGRGGAG